MYIEKVEIAGFKSFARRVELLLGPGICVVMGPNGCGKTNILDAIRWAIGEQKMSLLRGSVLEDVIFNGSQTRKPLGFAEVSVQIADCQGLLPYDPTADRVRLGRYITRNGDSQFFINGQPVRLKDIRSILGTIGLGDTGYAVMEQEMMKRILSNADDRRLLFEQAAGIAKYKSDKSATISRLQSAEEDLVKLDSVIREVEENEKSLRQQVTKARRYGKIREKIIHIYSELFSSKIGSINKKISELTERKKEISAQLESIEIEIVSMRTQRNNLATEIEELNREIRNIRGRVAELIEELHNNEKEDVVLSERIENAKYNIEQILKRRELTQKEIEENKLKIQETEKSLTSIKQKKSSVHSEHDKLESQVNTIEKEILAIRRQIDELESAENKHRNKFMELQNKIGFFSNEIETLNTKISRMEEQEEKENKKYLQLCENEKNLLEKANELKNQEKNVIEKIQCRQKELEEIVTKAEEITEKIRVIETENAEITGRLSELEKIVESKAFVDKKLEDLRRKKNWKSISELFTVDDVETAKQLALALGEKQNFLTVPDRKSALEALEEIESGNAGFIILNELENSLGWSNVTVEDERLWSIIDGFHPIENGVQKRGEIRISKSETSLMTPIVAKTLQKKLKQKLAKNNEEIENYEKLLSSLLSHRKNTEQDIHELSDNRDTLNQNIRNIENEITKCKSEIEMTKARIKNIENERLEAQKRKSEILKNIEEWENLSASEKETRQKIENDISNAKNSLSILQSRYSELEKRMSALAIEMVGIESELANCENDAKTAKIAIENLRKELDENERLEGEIREGIEIAQRKKSSIAETIEKISNEIETKSSLVEQLEDKKNELEKKLKEIEKNEREKNESKVKLDSILISIEKELSAFTTELEQISIRAQEILKTVPKAKEPHSVEQEQILEKTIEKLSRSLENLGPVNFEAEQTYNQIKEKLDRLLYQKNDVLVSISDLRETISRLDKEAKEKFITTFEKARKNFAEVFQKLFNGGEADLVLENSDEPLTSDIKVICRPPGKKVLSLSQLSAGEKALVSLALLFGLYLIKPSPFCLMDEVDAPLDEANIDRFLMLIREFSEKIQFIIVSHNPKTLENSDFIYGVSMEQEGISKVFSVKMADPKLGLQWR